MSDRRKTVFERLKEKGESLGFGEMPVILLVYEGNIVGFNQPEPPTEKFREKGGE